MSTKIFVRERRKIQKGEKKPRFRVLGVSGIDLKIYVRHMRKKELAQLSDATGALNLNKIGVPAGGPRQSSTARKPALTADSEVEVEATDRVSGGSGLAGPGFTRTC